MLTTVFNAETYREALKAIVDHEIAQDEPGYSGISDIGENESPDAISME